MVQAMEPWRGLQGEAGWACSSANVHDGGRLREVAPLSMDARPVTREMDALVLAGGESRRMGLSKAFLPLGSGTLVSAVVEALRPLFQRVLLVVGDPEGWGEVDAEVVTDDRPEQGPLVGITSGLAASNAPWCFVVGCDMPFLQPQVILRMAERLEGCDALVPILRGCLHPLHAFYSQRCLSPAVRVLDEGSTSPLALLRACRMRTMAEAEFLDIDPDLLSFRDVDTDGDYRWAQELLTRMGRGDMAP